MMRRTGCAMLALLPLACSPAAAQVERKLDIGVTAGAQYDSNVARATASQAAARGLDGEDVRFTAALDVDIALPFGRQSVFLQGSVGYVTYARNERLNRERIDLSGGVDGTLGRCRSKITAGYARGQSALEDIDFGLVKNVQERRSIEFQGRCGKGFGLEPLVTARREETRNSNDSRRTSDHDSWDVSAGVGYSQTAFGDLSLYGSYGKTSYPNRLVLVGLDQLSDGYEVYAGGVRYERQIGSQLRGRVTAAYTKLESNLPNVDGFSGLTYGAQLTMQPTHRLQARLLFDRAVQSSNRLDVSYQLAKTYSAEAEYAISPRLRVTLGGSIRERAYEKAGTLPLANPDDERITSLSGALRFQQSERLSFQFDVVNDKRDADNPLFEYSATRAGVSATAEF